MDYFILILVVLIINCELGELSTTDNPHIIFTKLSSNKRPLDAVHTQYTVLANKPMYLHFQNITRGWCYDYYTHARILDQEELPTMNSTIHFFNVTHNMSTLWKCNVTENNILGSPMPFSTDFWQFNNKKPKTKYQAFYLNLHVKGAKSVEVTVNGKELTFSETDLSVPYDGHAIYFYEDGEHVRIVCRNPQSTGTVHLEYLTKDVTNESNSARFGIHLRSGSKNSYIDCVHNATKPTDRYVYRVTFVTSKQLFYLNESNQDTAGEYSPLILGSSIGAVIIVLGIASVACWYVRTRIKDIEAPYMMQHSESATQQYATERENQYNACYDTSENVENIDPKNHFYTEIDYLTCKPIIEETQTRNNRVYDELYVQITMAKLQNGNVGQPCHTINNHCKS